MRILYGTYLLLRGNHTRKHTNMQRSLLIDFGTIGRRVMGDLSIERNHKRNFLQYVFKRVLEVCYYKIQIISLMLI